MTLNDFLIRISSRPAMMFAIVLLAKIKYPDMDWKFLLWAYGIYCVNHLFTSIFAPKENPTLNGRAKENGRKAILIEASPISYVGKIREEDLAGGVEGAATTTKSTLP